MSRDFEGLAGQPGHQIGAFLEQHYGVALGHLLPDDVAARVAAAPLSGYEYLAEMALEPQSAATVHDNLRAEGVLPPHLLDQTAFSQYFVRLAAIDPQAPIPRALSDPAIDSRIAPAKRRAFQAATALMVADTIEGASAEFEQATAHRVERQGDARYATSRYGMRVALPDNNGGFVELLSAISPARQRAGETTRGIWQAGALIARNYFGRQLGRIQAQRAGVQGQLIFPDRDLLMGMQELRDRRSSIDPGYDAVMLTNSRRLQRSELDEVIAGSHELLGPNGLLIIGGPADSRMATDGVISMDVIAAARSVFGEPAYFETFQATVPSLGVTAVAQEAVFVK